MKKVKKNKRNSPCWCGSGVKYKKCHYGREQEEKISRGEAIKITKSFKSKKYCCVPDVMKTSCTKRIIKAHSISKSGCLSEIADETNHVLGLKVSLSSLDRNNGIIKPEKIGINNASTFNGFCSYHDSSIFSPIENEKFKSTEEQCFLLAYRSIARETFTKSNPDKFINQLKMADKGMSVNQQLGVQALASALETNMELDVQELAGYKNTFDEGLINSNFSFLNHLVIELNDPPPVMVSTIVAPNTDFHGKRIQDNTNPNSELQYVMVNAFSSDKKGYIVLSWVGKDQIITDFIQSLQSIESDKIISALIGFFFIYAENVYISPIWWNGITEEMQKSIIGKIHQGMVRLPTDCLSSCKNEYGSFEISGTQNVNFS